MDTCVVYMLRHMFSDGCADEGVTTCANRCLQEGDSRTIQKLETSDKIQTNEQIRSNLGNKSRYRIGDNKLEPTSNAKITNKNAANQKHSNAPANLSQPTAGTNPPAESGSGTDPKQNIRTTETMHVTSNTKNDI